MVFNIFSLKHIIASYHVQGDDKENLVSSWPEARARTSCGVGGCYNGNGNTNYHSDLVGVEL